MTWVTGSDPFEVAGFTKTLNKWLPQREFSRMNGARRVFVNWQCKFLSKVLRTRSVGLIQCAYFLAFHIWNFRAVKIWIILENVFFFPSRDRCLGWFSFERESAQVLTEFDFMFGSGWFICKLSSSENSLRPNESRSNEISCSDSLRKIKLKKRSLREEECLGA